MKVRKDITLDLKVAQKLSNETNASALIERLLIAHYKLHELDTLPELEKELKRLEAKAKFDKEIEVINGK